ncbi:SAM-dependent methyltransferases [Thiohalobacter thiocyanaticus]|uniref:SAM-dependent methyltransferases n=1 Tax=Thiohalobacter thiocyanaticus TaxID=585455 RepID=A0A1Z4VNX0_9GAMM|nr:class I SAM-dependent methyltransferase [Thiohalobacter thiocyanaticus]BAZ93195.1 SAM-dependent methyltransferases [Thiohalobacter thiocyanaticus]
MQQQIQSFLQAGRINEALQLAEQHCNTYPDQADSWLLKASIQAFTGNIAEVAAACSQALKVQPGHTQARYNLAVALHALGRTAEAIEQYQVLLKTTPNHPQALANLGLLHRNVGDLESAEACSRKALSLQPEFASAHNTLGLIHEDRGELEPALAAYLYATQCDSGLQHARVNAARCYWLQGDSASALDILEKLVETAPDFADNYLLLARIHANADQPEEAVASLRAAIRTCRPDHRLHHALAGLHQQAGNLQEAIREYGAALKINPTAYRSHNNLGTLLHTNGQTREGLRHLKEAARQRPDLASIQANLSLLHAAIGNQQEALIHSLRALQLDPGNRTHGQQFARIAGSTGQFHNNAEFRKTLAACFQDEGIDQQYLIGPVMSLLRSHPELAKRLTRRDWTDDLQAFDCLWHTPERPLLEAILCQTVIPDSEIEDCLRQYRSTALFQLTESTGCPASLPDIDTLARLTALAHQCHNNEFVYACSPDERDRTQTLREFCCRKLLPSSQAYITGTLLLACYGQLPFDWPIPNTPMRIETSIAERLRSLWEKHIYHPQLEEHIKHALPALTQIQESSSDSVRAQYEKSPYPRWLSLDLYSPRSYKDLLREELPHFVPPDFGTESIDILIAGCGTGKHALLSASRLKHGSITAIDLSRSSLAYAQRRAHELGFDEIKFFQGDILELDELEQRFHIIESVGVLHHLADPARGLLSLRRLLQPNGIMNLGFYSRTARQAVQAARRRFEAGQRLDDLDAIRAVRQEIRTLPPDDELQALTRMQDFYSLSECRDLIFHAQEHVYTLPEIQALLDRAELDFVGFEIQDMQLKHRYLQAFPDDPDLTNLTHWDQFEQRHPDTFIGMYTFWCQARD